MSDRRAVGLGVALALFLSPMGALAQLPGGIGIPSLPSGGLSKDALLAQAREILADLTSMKTSGKLAPDQTQQVDALLPKAASLTNELEKPQVDAGKLPQLASSLGDLQRQVGALKGLVR
jgi:hypothetical protein